MSVIESQEQPVRDSVGSAIGRYIRAIQIEPLEPRNAGQRSTDFWPMLDEACSKCEVSNNWSWA